MIIENRCTRDDIKRVRDFLQETYQQHGKKINWLIDRLNFSYSLSRIMNNVSEEEYLDRIRFYETEGQIESVVITEGENRGEAFMFFRDLNCDRSLLNRMFDYIESHLMINDNDTSFVNLRIPKDGDQIIQYAIDRGFLKQEWTEMVLSKVINGVTEVTLKPGYSFVSTEKISSEKKAIAHSLAFGYNDQTSSVMNCKTGMQEVERMLDYNPRLDIQMVDEYQQIVSFCTLWHDEVNHIGILEPVGTIPSHQKLGLSKATIQEASNRLYQLGGKKLYVGSDQKFYKAIGFCVDTWDYVYKKSKKRC